MSITVNGTTPHILNFGNGKRSGHIKERLRPLTEPFASGAGPLQRHDTLSGLGNPEGLPNIGKCAVCSSMGQISVGTVDDHRCM